MCSSPRTDDAVLAELLDRAGADLPALLKVVEEALRRVGSLPLGGAVPDGVLTQAVQWLESLARRCQGQKLALVAEIASRETHRAHGGATTEDLLARTLNLSRGEARAQAELAEGLAALPATAQALKDGRIGLGQAAVTVKKAGELEGQEGGAALVGDLDAHAAAQGQALDRNRLGRELDAFTQRRGVSVLAAREQRAAQRRGLWFTERDGLPAVEAILSVEGMAVLKAALGALGRPDGADDRRTPAQRHADALVTLAEQRLDGGELPQVATQRPHVLLITTPESLHGEENAEPSLLDGVGPVSTELARQICCDAEVTRVITDRNGAILDVGRAQRLPSKAQRAAVVARDRCCIGCGANVTRCQVHHVRWWRNNGRTDLGNLVLVCWNCHRHIHHHGWEVWRDAAGRYRAGPSRERPASTPAQRHTGQRPLPPVAEGCRHAS